MRLPLEESERKKLLRECPVFREMNEESEKILLSLEPRDYNAGDIIAGEDDTRALGLMLSGKASIFGKSGTDKVLLNLVGKADVFNAATVFFPEKEAVSKVVAKTKCRVLFISRDCLETIIKSDFAVASAYIALLSGKIYFLNRKIIAFTARRADAALAGFLLDSVPEGETFSVNMSRLARVLDMGRTTLYRVVDMLTEDGSIAYDGKEIKILNRKQLEKRYKQ